MNLYTKNYWRKNLTKYFFAITAFLLLTSSKPVYAKEVSPLISVSGNQDVSAMSDGNYNTAAVFSSGDSVTITAPENAPIYGIYIKWNAPVKPYTILADDTSINGGSNGFLHEYIPFSEGAGTITLQIESDNMQICNLQIFDSPDIPEDVQIWNPPVEKADICMISSHSDDEILFLGGIIPTYGMEQGASIQVIYMTEYWTGAKIREHEKLDGLWTDGLRNYPVTANLPDLYAETLEDAERIYSLENATDYLAGAFRHFQPQVVVTHDFNGEYGHGFHQFTAKATSLALDLANDDSYTITNSEFANLPVYNVPKAYFHLYPDNPIHLDLRVPLQSMNGQTALEVATAAYKQHVSQQWCWFYVSDEYSYSCADFGLFRSLVGKDTQNNMLENITTYKRQAEIEAQRISEEQKRLEEERIAEEKRKEQTQKESESTSVESVPAIKVNPVNKTKRLLSFICITLVCILAILTFVYIGILHSQKKKRRKKRIRK